MLGGICMHVNPHQRMKFLLLIATEQSLRITLVGDFKSYLT